MKAIIPMMLILVVFLIILLFYNKSFINVYLNFSKSYYLLFMSITMSLLFFSSNNLVYFFIFFELSIIPMFFHMIYFGMTEKKMVSSLYLLIYTSVFSMMFILWMLNFKKVSNLIHMESLFFIMKLNLNFYNIMMILIFMVKIPMFFIHIWLPKAHVESSTIGSMILASVMLKLGAYSLLIFSISVFNYVFLIIFLMFLVFYSIYIIMSCFFMNDYKMIIAYFSISHMSLVIISVFNSMNFNSFASMMMMLAHSISSPLLFFFNYMFYNSFSSRMINKMNSMIFNSNSMFWLFFMVLMMNMSIPPTLNFFSELAILINLMKFFFIFSCFFMMMFILSGLISIFLLFKMSIFKEMNHLNMTMNIKCNLYLNFCMFGIFMLMYILFTKTMQSENWKLNDK